MRLAFLKKNRVLQISLCYLCEQDFFCCRILVGNHRLESSFFKQLINC